MSRTSPLTTAAFTALLLTGCNRNAGAPASVTADGLTKIKVGYIGITCEAPIFSAVENGYFKEEGLEVELVKCEWSKYKDVLALGGYDITHHLIMYFLKPIEQGAGCEVHRGHLHGLPARRSGRRAAPRCSSSRTTSTKPST